MLEELGHEVVGDNVAVDGWVAEALEVFEVVGGGFVLEDGEFGLTGPLSELAGC
jgi:hypothetical protein